MEIKTKYNKKDEVYFIRNGEPRKSQIVGIQIIYGLINGNHLILLMLLVINRQYQR
jgi:hypothetical protein